MTPEEAFELYRRTWRKYTGQQIPHWEEIHLAAKYAWAEVVSGVESVSSTVDLPIAGLPEIDRLKYELKKQEIQRREAELALLSEQGKSKRLNALYKTERRQRQEADITIQSLLRSTFRPRRTSLGGFHRSVTFLKLRPEDIFASHEVSATWALCESAEMEFRIASAIEFSPDWPVAEVIGWIQQARKAQKIRRERASRAVEESQGVA